MPQSQPQQPAQPCSILRQDHHESQSGGLSPRAKSSSGYFTQSPRATPKTVSIAREAEVISPLMLGSQKNVEELDLDGTRSPRRTSVKSYSSRRLSGRPPLCPSPFLRPSSSLHLSSEVGEDSESNRGHRHLDEVIDQVSEWIKHERLRRSERKAKRKERAHRGKEEVVGERANGEAHRRQSDASDQSVSLDQLEDIIKHSLSLERRPPRRGSIVSKRRASLRKLSRNKSSFSSDTEHNDAECFVPSCDVVLDNSKTLSYAGGASDVSDDSGAEDLHRTTSYRDLNAWDKFKFEIVRLSHTLRLKGWRRIPMERSSEICVQRLSGALTNAVYVVSPPDELDFQVEGDASDYATLRSKKPPPKLLLRIYGPQVEHLIDREAELAILRRLAAKNIGPRLLGTFANGRFEEYFYAKTLTPDDLRCPDTSRQIAKRMRELHDGVELLEEERDDGPFVWRNWDKWLNRVEQVVCWLDSQILKLPPGAKPAGDDAWKRRGFICGLPWKNFRAMVEKYREWLYAQYGGREAVREHLVFAHNDTQYGNILRLMPTSKSPLLLPANSHRQLVVIDFEYASANLQGLEFANHFTEWCYNYHDPRKPYAFHPKLYPTPEDQDRFVRAYVRHRPQFNVSTPKLGPSTPSTDSLPQVDAAPNRRTTSSISSYMLDARTPSSNSTSQVAEDAANKAQEDIDVARLIHETRIWRLANTAQWVAWGIVQAKVPGMPDFGGEDVAAVHVEDDAGLDPANGDGEENGSLEDGSQGSGSAQEEAEEEFDYLGYAQHRALFFWADAMQLGLIKAEELPEELRAKVKMVPY